MSFEKETYNLLSNNNNEAVKLLYETYAKKLLAYTCKNYTIDKDDAWAIVYKTIYKIFNSAFLKIKLNQQTQS